MSLSTDPNTNQSPSERLAETLDVGVTAVVLKFYEQVVSELREWVKPHLNARLQPGDSERPFVVTPSGVRVPIGRNTRSSPAPAPRIVDEAAFTAWIEEHYPDQVEIKKTVRAPFKKRFTTDPLGQHVLGPNSEVDPPGLAVGQREPSASTTADLNMIRELWLSGQTDEIQAVMADAMRGLVLGQLPSGEVPQ